MIVRITFGYLKKRVESWQRIDQNATWKTLIEYWGMQEKIVILPLLIVWTTPAGAQSLTEREQEQNWRPDAEGHEPTSYQRSFNLESLRVPAWDF